MATQKLKLQVNNFLNGLNTDATVLDILPSELLEGSVNVELLRNGSIRRRRGIDFFGLADSTDSGLTTYATRTIADNNPLECINGWEIKITTTTGELIERIIVDLDNMFYIYKADSTSLSNPDAPEQTLSRGIQSNAKQKFAWMEFAQSGNRVFFAGRHIQPGFLKFNEATDLFELEYYDVLIRDPDATTIGVKVSNNSEFYECIEAHTSSAADEPGVGANWERYWILLRTPLPSSPTAWAISTAYTTTILKRYNKLDTVADADTRPSTVEHYGGRVWLGGDPEFPNIQYFSQTIVRDENISRFLQAADPFDPDDSLLVESDGGTIETRGGGQTQQFLATTTSLFNGTTLGIYEITGPSGIFKATDFSNLKILSDRVEGPANMVLTDKQIVIFANNNIWRSTETSLLTVSDTTNFVRVQLDRLDEFYNVLSIRSKAAGRAVYDAHEHLIYWLYDDEINEIDIQQNPNNYPLRAKNMLVLRTRFDRDLEREALVNVDKSERNLAESPAFIYTFSLDILGEDPYVAGAIETSVTKKVSENVVVNDVLVVDSSDEQVVSGVNRNVNDTIMFLNLRRFVNTSDATKYDWQNGFTAFSTSPSHDYALEAAYKTEFSSSAIFGSQTLGDVSAKKAVMYLYFIFKKVETGVLVSGVDTNPGGALVTTAWNWAVNSTSNKFSTQRQVYFPDRFTQSLADGGLDGHDHVWFKHRVRGRGTAFAVTLDNDGTKDFHLVGWTQQFHGKP